MITCEMSTSFNDLGFQNWQKQRNIILCNSTKNCIKKDIQMCHVWDEQFSSIYFFLHKGCFNDKNFKMYILGWHVWFDS